VIRFKRPVDIPVDKLSDACRLRRFGAARPDGAAIRLSLAPVTVKRHEAGERFRRLCCRTAGRLAASLPQGVIRELSERAR